MFERSREEGGRVSIGRLNPGAHPRPTITLAQYVGLVVVAAAASLAIPPTWRLPAETWLTSAAVLTVLSIALEFKDVPLRHGGALSVATIGHVALILLVPPPFAAPCVGLSVAVEQVVRRTGFLKIVFNVAGFVLTTSLASCAVGFFGDLRHLVRSGTPDHLAVFGAFFVAIVVYYAVNMLLTAGVIAVATRRPFLYMVRINTRNTRTSELGAAAIGALFALIWVEEPLWTVSLALPAAVISLSLSYIRKLENETRDAIKALASSVDRRDPFTYGHSTRVATYSVALASELELDADLVDLIGLVASVHDLGKMGVPDSILLKSGPLNPEERAKMMTHAAAGADVLQQFDLFRPGADIVRHHHENYDGTGYPDGLAGQSIPLGSRVVAVADGFDAMTSDRPYRSSLSVQEAVTRLRAGAGTQWDPIAIGAFLRVIIERRIELPVREPAADLVTAAADLVAAAATPVATPGARPAEVVLLGSAAQASGLQAEAPEGYDHESVYDDDPTLRILPRSA